MPPVAMGANSTSATSLTITLGAGAAVGDRVLLWYGENPAAETTITDSKGNDWTTTERYEGPATDVASHLQVGVITTALVAGDTITIATGTTSTAKLAAVIGLGQPHADDRHRGDYTYRQNTTTWTATLPPPLWTNVTALAFVFSWTSGAIRTSTPGTDWTELYDFGLGSNSLTIAYREMGSGHTTLPAPTGTFNLAATRIVTFVREFRPAGSSASASPFRPTPTIARVGNFTRAPYVWKAVKALAPAAKWSRAADPTSTYGQDWPRA